MAYEVWSVPSGSLLATYASEAEALADVRAAFAEHGEEYVRGLLLGHEDRRGRSHLIAEGEALVQRALQAKATSPTRAASA
jgi:ribulose bisphosphate carboxylase small subunit